MFVVKVVLVTKLYSCAVLLWPLDPILDLSGYKLHLLKQVYIRQAICKWKYAIVAHQGVLSGVTWLYDRPLRISSLHVQRARTMNGKFGPVNCSRNENGWVCLKEYWFSKWIPADFMSVVMTSFSNRFLNYDVINSVITTEIQLLWWN